MQVGRFELTTTFMYEKQGESDFVDQECILAKIRMISWNNGGFRSRTDLGLPQRKLF